MAYQTERPELENKQFVDYKDIVYLRQFMNTHAKIVARKRTGMPADKQREITLAIKRARYMGLLPYLAS